jgi:hypothetical protein
MLVVTLTAQELKGYRGALRAQIRADAETEARDRRQRTVRIVAPDGRLVEQFVVETAARGLLPRRSGVGLASSVIDQLAQRMPNRATAWKQILAAWKEKREAIGRRWIGGLYVYEGVYYRIVRGKPVRAVRGPE